MLADVIDLFAGTSTGAIIAAFLAWGYPVEEVERLYVSHAGAMFARQRLWNRLKTKYRAQKIAEFFRTHFQDDDGTPALLGSARLKTLLLVIMANASTGSPWPVSNNPHATYNDRRRPDCNLNVPLWQLLRASTAAPTFFQPEQIQLGGHRFLFVDGGVTPYNNPSLIAALMATMPCYKLNWETGPDKLRLISIGTGGQRKHFTTNLANKVYLWNSLDFFVHGIIGVVGVNQDMLCRIFGHCIYGPPIDAELDRLDVPLLLPPAEQKFSYARYNVQMDTPEVGVPLSERELKLDNLAAIPRLREIGQAYARQHVHADGCA